MKTKKKQTNHNRRTATRSHLPTSARVPFIEHLYELRRRLYFVAISVVVWSSAAYAVQQQVVGALLRPAKGEHFIYTTPGGGIDFLFKICLYSGLVLSLPVIVYNSLRFIEPIITRSSQRFILWGSAASGVLAIAGGFFGYYIGLPAALHFLTHQFTTVQIQPLVTIQSYLSFVIVYMVGSAMLFQLPLMLIFINRIKPLKPHRLLRYERWVVLAAFILAGLMNPTPNMISQLLIAGPFIIMYQLGILLIAFINRSHRLSTVELLHRQDVEAQASRIARVPSLRPLPVQPPVATTQNPARRQLTDVAGRIPSAVPGRLNPSSVSQPLPRAHQKITAVSSARQSRTFHDIRSGFSRPPLQSIDRLHRGSI